LLDSVNVAVWEFAVHGGRGIDKLGEYPRVVVKITDDLE
jgi:hypothetical protein